MSWIDPLRSVELRDNKRQTVCKLCAYKIFVANVRQREGDGEAAPAAQRGGDEAVEEVEEVDVVVPKDMQSNNVDAVIAARRAEIGDPKRAEANATRAARQLKNAKPTLVGEHKDRFVAHLKAVHGLQAPEGDDAIIHKDKADRAAALVRIAEGKTPTRTPTMTDAVARIMTTTDAAKTKTQRESAAAERAVLLWIASGYHSFSEVEREETRELMAGAAFANPGPDRLVIKSRKTAAEKMDAFAVELRRNVIELHKDRRVTLAWDSCTVASNRYVAAVMICGVERVVIAIEAETTMSFEGVLAAEKLRAWMEALKQELAGGSVFVVNIVSDNGSNFVKASLGIRDTFFVHCVAHCLNLMSKASLNDIPLLKLAVDTIKALSEAHPKQVSRIVETRWSSALEAAKSALIKYTELNPAGAQRSAEQQTVVTLTTAALTTAIAALAPFVEAIDMIQGAGGKVFRAIEALAMLWRHCATFRIQTIARGRLGAGETSLLTHFEHHATNNALSGPIMIVMLVSGCVGFYEKEHFINTATSYAASDAAVALIKNVTKNAVVTSAQIRAELHKYQASIGPMRAELDERLLREHLTQTVGKTLGCAWLPTLVLSCAFEMEATEADAERAFRALNLTVPDERQSIACERAGSCLLVNSVASWLKAHRRKTAHDVDAPPPSPPKPPTAEEELDAIANEEVARKRRENVSDFIEYYATLVNEHLSSGNARALRPGGVRPDSRKCIGCDSTEAQHQAAAGSRVQCDNYASCGQWAFHRCANLRVGATSFTCVQCVAGRHGAVALIAE